ncbi:TPA: superantigen-like protein [Staphylococcus argenteus]|uniref:exotoxin beta-grasp domain-containing protein n=1 Tax=Staphylococcus argenteus TaxID=985002 RepID=UPI000501C0F8|nr:superantigen-like protein [Staphylococcus argenteus]MBE2137477.1 superantigen-like protein [Staphylococcus argenteus]MDT3004794.1 superantigen-like protein [Staphylococcus argenteus]UPO21206.1 superantigen-like protein [Staphylococcus argenteus]CDR64762.1 exotoxin [Staphylococcus argenteus]HDY9445850.1 superantigen-like protein [Staphylococcus argenteus]
MKMTQIVKTSLVIGLLTTGLITTTRQAANASTLPSTIIEQQVPKANAEKALPTNPEQATKPNIEKVSISPSTKVEAMQQTPNATTTPSTKVEISQPQSIKPTTLTEINSKYKDLRAYYTKPSLEFENQFGFMLKPWTTVRFMNIIPERFIYKIALVGKDDKKYKDGPYDHIDAFIVLEDNKYGLKKYSVGGITKTNSKNVDRKVELNITKEDDKGAISRDVSEYKITKEEISLKELDFKLRKQLIEKHNLYSNIGSGTIVIKMKNGGKYTFELHKKLQEHRMADVIDGTNIDKIEVNIK